MSGSSAGSAGPGPRLGREQTRAVDRIATAELGIPGLLLMEDAGLGATLAMLARLGPWDDPARPVVVLCGGGNNGGDGWVVARQLLCRRVPVRVLAAAHAERLPPDAAAQRRMALACGVPACEGPDLSPATLQRELDAACAAVDALLGTGFRGEVREPLATWIGTLNRVRAARSLPVVALDLPSGLDADSGLPAASTVRADLTATFVASKLGFERAHSRAWTGEVVVVPIGTPPALLERVASDERPDIS